MTPSMESIFLILSGVILAAGVLYWFWSHIQLTQKKVQLLENAVFELRSLVTGPEGSRSSPGPSSTGGPQPVFQDLADDDEWAGDAEAPAPAPQEEQQGAVSDDLAPGGRIEVPKEEVADVPLTPDQFRDLFARREAEVLPAPAAAAAPPTESNTVVSSSESLDSMPVKELRRLAEQRGLTGVSELRKKELLTALRQQVVAPTVVKAAVTSDTVTVERVLDLTETIGEEDAVTLE